MVYAAVFINLDNFSINENVLIFHIFSFSPARIQSTESVGWCMHGQSETNCESKTKCTSWSVQHALSRKWEKQKERRKSAYCKCKLKLSASQLIGKQMKQIIGKRISNAFFFSQSDSERQKRGRLFHAHSSFCRYLNYILIIMTNALVNKNKMKQN